MEVKSIYLDLQKAEPKKRGNKTVWKLESEAFKEPLELKIGYEDKELAEFQKKYDSLYKAFLDIEKELDLWNTIQVNHDKQLKELWERICKQWILIAEKDEKIENQNKEISQLYKVIADAKTTIETQSGTILHLQEEIKLIQKKITKQPMVFSDTTFISGHERVGLWILEVPSGEYLLIEKYLLLEANEFVENCDGIKFNKITVTDNQYIPMYNLFWWTPLDTPTAKVYRTLVFIPC